jgi:nucleotide-binding universal stress UspA family protein
MMPPKLLLLTDFSPLSALAIEYAVRLAAPLHADFTILNIVRLEGIPKANLKLKAIEKSLLKVSQEEGEALVEKIRKQIKGNYTLTFKAVRSHTVAEAVSRYVDKNQVNMVVMGSRGASTLKKIRLGGTTVSVIDVCKAPVLAIPEFAQFNGLKNIVYASDLKNVGKELDIITEFAEIYGSHVHMIRVLPVMDKKAEEEKDRVEELIRRHSYKKLDFKIILDDNIPGAIDRYIQQTKSDLLTTFTHSLSLEEKLFAKSVTRTLAYLGRIPLLAVKRK